MALSKVDLANQVENQLPQNLVANNLPFRNIIINGDMSIAQRGTSVVGTTDGYKICDRWYFKRSVGTINLAQSAQVPTGQGFAQSFQVVVTSGASPSAGDRQYIEQRFEGQNLQYLKKGTANAESVTLSFWIKSSVTGTYIIQLYDVDNDRSISKSYTIDSADTWEKKTITFAGDTTGAFGNDNSHDLSLRFFLSAGTNYTSGTLQTSWATNVNANQAVGQVNFPATASNELYLTGVQLEAGTTASDFEFLPYDVNLQRCQRYYEEIYFAFKVPTEGVTDLASAIGGIGYYSVTKRASPTVSRTDITTESVDTLSNTGYNIGIEFNGRVTSGTRSRWIGTARADAEL